MRWGGNYDKSETLALQVPVQKCVPVPVKVEGQKCVNVPTQSCETVPVVASVPVPQKQVKKIKQILIL